MAAPKLFGNASTFDPQLFHSADESAETLLSGKPSGKYSSLEVAQWLEGLALAAGTSLDQARQQLGAAASEPAFRRIEEDVLIQRGLALFFAGKLRSAVLWQLHVLTGLQATGDASIAAYTGAREAWAKMAARAGTVYRSQISYGGNLTSGHWLDRVPAFDDDIADLRRRLKQPVEVPPNADPTAAKRALQAALAVPVRLHPTAEHVPAKMFVSEQPLPLALSVKEAIHVTLHYRHVNQAERWVAVVLNRAGDRFTGEIPAAYTAHRFPLQYYFEIQTGPAAATLFPPLAADLANVPYFVVRQNA